MDNLPVFDSFEGYHIWKTLNGKLTKQKLDLISSKIQSAPVGIHPAILISLMNALQAEYGSVSGTTMKLLVSKSRSQDCTPAIRAAELLVANNEITAAAEILANNTSKDMFRRYAAEAKIYHGEGDIIDAVDSARRALEIDPDAMELYDMLNEDDPSGLWSERKSVQEAYRGKGMRVPKDPRLRDLYSVYDSWFKGDKEAATDKLVNSEYYQDGDWEFLLASARLNADEKDWHSAKMVFDKLVQNAPIFVKYEAAEAFIAGHDPDSALDIYDGIDMTSPRSMKGRISAYAQKDSQGDLMIAISEYLDSEYTGTLDYSEMAGMLMSMGRYDDAKTVMDRMEASNRKDPAYLVIYSKYLLSKGDIRGAKATSRAAARVGKGDLPVEILAARIRFISEDVKGAEKDIDRILTEDPDNIDALVLKKDILVKKNDVQGALEICRRILESDPGDVTTMMTLSGAMSESGDMNGSMLTLRNVLRLDPSRENVLKVLCSMMEAGLYREAMYLCYDIEKDMAPDPEIRMLRGNAEYNLGEYVKASISYAAAAELAPNDPVIWHSKGMADEARGDFESAETSYNRAVLFDLNNSEYWISKAAIQERFDDLYGAVESLNRAIELDPDSVYPMARKAVILEKDGRYDEAMFFIDICSVTDPSNPDVALLRARVLRESGKPSDALAVALEVHAAVPSEDSALELANCYLANYKRYDALKVLEEALAKDETSARIRMAIDSIEEGSQGIESTSEEQEPGEEVLSSEDAAAAAAIADSMISIKDYKGALRAIDRAIAIDGEEPKYVCMKVSILLLDGDVRGAQDLATEALKSSPKSAKFHEAMGDVKLAKSEFRGALQEYEKAMALGLNLPEILAKKGDAQEGLGYYDRSIDSYSMAVNRDPTNRDLRYILAVKLFERGYLSRADAQAVMILEKTPNDPETAILLARIRKDSRKDSGVTEAYKLFRACNVQDEALLKEMSEVLVSAGHDEEARSLKKAEPEPIEDLRVKRSAEKVLRRAYVSRMAPDDEDLLMAMGFEGPELEEIRDYVQRDAPFGDIIPGSPDFQKMERASNEVVLKLNWKDLESGQKPSLEKIFVSGSFKDVDEAKRLSAYMGKALRCEVGRDDSLKMVLDRVQGSTLFEIMRACKVGIYQARQIQLLLKGQ